MNYIKSSIKKSEGYLETELAVISKSKLHLDDLHNSQISLMATSGSFSDRMSRLLTGKMEKKQYYLVMI